MIDCRELNCLEITKPLAKTNNFLFDSSNRILSLLPSFLFPFTLFSFDTNIRGKIEFESSFGDMLRLRIYSFACDARLSLLIIWNDRISLGLAVHAVEPEAPALVAVRSKWSQPRLPTCPSSSTRKQNANRVVVAWSDAHREKLNNRSEMLTRTTATFPNLLPPPSPFISLSHLFYLC